MTNSEKTVLNQILENRRLIDSVKSLFTPKYANDYFSDVLPQASSLSKRQIEDASDIFIESLQRDIDKDVISLKDWLLYDNCEFLSDDDRAWALFLTLTGADWEYRPMTFNLEGTLKFTPTFKVDYEVMRGRDSLWIDVLPNTFSEADFNEAMKDYPEKSDKLVLPDEYKRCVHAFSGKDADDIPINSLLVVPPLRLYMQSIERFQRSKSAKPPYFDLFCQTLRCTPEIDGILPYSFAYITGDAFTAYPCASDDGFVLVADDCKRLKEADILRTGEAFKNALDVACEGWRENG